jgi:hypothetical protein
MIPTPSMRVQRTLSSPLALREPLTRHALGSGKSQKWLGSLLLVASAAVGCTSATVGGSATPKTARSVSSFGQSLSLAVSLGNALTVGDVSLTAQFTLTNNGSAVFEGCFGPSWGVSVISGGHDAGYLVRADYPNCVERFTLLPRQTIVWSKKVPLNDLRAGAAKVTGWVKVVDPAACDPRYGCHEVSVASQLMTVPIGDR